MKTAFAYLRVSGKGQVEGDGFPRQLAAIKAYAKSNGIRIVQVFKEEGVSGTREWEDRPAFSEMMTALLTNGTRTVLVERLDRLARKLIVQERIVDDFRKKGLELISVANPNLCEDAEERAERDAMRQMLGTFAQYEKALLVAKLKAARQRVKAKTGRCEGRKPYGAMPGESDVIERMKTMRKNGETWIAIADTLNSTKDTKARKGSWHANSVRRVVLTSAKN